MNAVIVVRTGSTRLPKKCLLPFGEGNVLEHMILRVCELAYARIIVATTWLPEDDIIEGFVCNEYGKVAKCYRGCIDISSRLEDMREELDIDLDDLERIDGDDLFFVPKPQDGVHRYIGDWHDTVAGYKDCANKIRLTLDYWEDYWMLCTALRCLDYGHEANANEIVDLFNRNPDLHKINWFRQQDYEENQKCELKELDIPA